MSINAAWRKAHLKHCGCRKYLPPTILAEPKKQGKKCAAAVMSTKALVRARSMGKEQSDDE